MGCKWQVSHRQSHLGPSARGRGASPWEAPEFAVRARGSAVLGAVLQVTRWLPQNCDRISSGRKGGWPSDPWGGGGRGRGAAGELGPRATGPPSTRTAPAGPAWSRAQLGELARPHRGPVPLPGPACSVTHRPLPRPALAGAGVPPWRTASLHYSRGSCTHGWHSHEGHRANSPSATPRPGPR